MRKRLIMALSGNLSSFMLSTILQLLQTEKKTGVLRLSYKNKQAQLFFNTGDIVYAMASEKESRLGNLLVSKGLVSEHEINETLRESRERNKKIGLILVEKGLLSISMLKFFLEIQARDIVCSLFRWQGGDFTFITEPLNLIEEIITRLDTTEIIIEASRRINEWPVLIKQIPSDKIIYKLRLQTPDMKPKLNEDEDYILSLVNGIGTVRQIINRSGLDEFNVYRLLNSLIVSGVIMQSIQTKHSNAC